MFTSLLFLPECKNHSGTSHVHNQSSHVSVHCSPVYPQHESVVPRLLRLGSSAERRPTPEHPQPQTGTPPCPDPILRQTQSSQCGGADSPLHLWETADVTADVTN